MNIFKTCYILRDIQKEALMEADSVFFCMKT